MAHRVRIIGPYQHVDRPVLDLDFRILKQLADAIDFNRAIDAGHRRERGSAHQLIGIAQLILHGPLDLGLIEAPEDIDQVQARHRVLAAQAPDQLRDRALIDGLLDDPEQGGLVVIVLRVGGLQQFTDAEACALGIDNLHQR